MRQHPPSATGAKQVEHKVSIPRMQVVRGRLPGLEAGSSECTMAQCASFRSVRKLLVSAMPSTPPLWGVAADLVQSQAQRRSRACSKVVPQS